MAHPFEKMFVTALAKSTEYDNQVTKVAEGLLAKGYQRTEVLSVLERLHRSLLDDAEQAIVAETLEELSDDD